MNFNGTDESIVVNNSSVTQFPRNEPYSVSFWINASTFILNSKGIMGNGNFANAVYAKTTYASGVWGFGWYMAGRAGWGDQLVVSTGNTLVANTWYHVCITYNGNALASGLKMYIDYSNVYNGTGALNYSDPVTNNNDWYIARNGPSGIHFPGKIDEVAIWNKALSDTEVAALATANAPANLMALSAKPIAYWPLGEFAGNSGELGGTPSGQTNSWKFPNQVLKDYVFTTTGSSSRRFFLRDVNISNSTPVTLSIWFKKNGSGSFSSIISRSPYGISINGTSQIIVYRSYPAAYKTYNFGTLTDGNWHHLVYTGTELTNGIGKVYIDGIESTSGSQTDYLERNAIRTLGNASANNSWKFNGDLSNYSIWTSVLTDVQVLDLYNNGSPKDLTSYSPTPERWLKLNSSSTYQNPKANYTSAIDFPANNVNGVELPSTLTLSNSFTISFWAKIDSKPSNASLIGTANSTYGIRYVGNSNAISLVTYNLGIRVAYFTVDLPGISNQLIDSSPKTFHHFTIVSQGSDSSSTTKLYLNGQLSSSITQPQGALSIDFIGGSSVSGTFDGQMSNIAIWDGTELNSSQVKTIYNEGTPELSISHSPTHWWKFNNTSNSSNSDGLYDNGSGSLNLTNQNGTATTIDVAVDNWEVENVLDANSKGAVGVGLTRSDLIPSDLQFESPYSNFSLDFDGTGNYFDLTQHDLGTTNTISLWLNISSITADQTVLGEPSNAFKQSIIIASNIIYIKDVSNHFKGWNLSTSSEFSLNNWHHFGIVRSGSTVTFYINGIDQGSPDASSGAFTANTKLRYLGTNYATNTQFVDGKIDEIALWSSALTATQVNQIYNNGRPGDLSSLSPVSWWRLGEDAFFVNNNITIPNQISGGPTGTGSGTQTAMLSADAPQSYGGGYGVGLAVTDKIGDAPNSTANSLSYNMIPDNRHPYIPGYVPAKVDNAFSMSFDGQSYFSVDHSALSTITNNPFSVSMWFKKPTGASQKYLGGASDSTSSASVAFNFSVTDKILWYGPAAGGVVTVGTYHDNNWHHVVFVAESATSSKIYVDGVDDTNMSNRNRIASSAIINPINIGASNTGSLPWNGHIDEVAFFDYALTAKQIKEDIYNASTTGKTADLSNNSNLTAPIAWYRMGD